ncbi:HigA family addiction module antitoxin [Ampullimonas aquatilis]|uniref:HigA family addiction module antitoxin n=1 Tax=Ampullimonas aquatilis TaxID=1341549 RepID=UPI003C78DC13
MGGFGTPQWKAASQQAKRLLRRPPGVPTRTPVHPGQFLQKHYLIPLHLNQTQTAKMLGISRRRLNEIIQGHRAMTPDTAIRCALMFGMETSFWLTLQSSWDSFQAWKLLASQSQSSAVSADTTVSL